MEELLLVWWMVLLIYGVVCGVGGIDSWGIDVEFLYYIFVD